MAAQQVNIEIEITSLQFAAVQVSAAPQDVEVQYIGIKGDQGEPGEMGHIFVGPTAPPDPELNDLWVDTS